MSRAYCAAHRAVGLLHFVPPLREGRATLHRGDMPHAHAHARTHTYTHSSLCLSLSFSLCFSLSLPFTHAPPPIESRKIFNLSTLLCHTHAHHKRLKQHDTCTPKTRTCNSARLYMRTKAHDPRAPAVLSGHLSPLEGRREGLRKPQGGVKDSPGQDSMQPLRSLSPPFLFVSFSSCSNS